MPVYAMLQTSGNGAGIMEAQMLFSNLQKRVVTSIEDENEQVETVIRQYREGLICADELALSMQQSGAEILHQLRILGGRALHVKAK